MSSRLTILGLILAVLGGLLPVHLRADTPAPPQPSQLLNPDGRLDRYILDMDAQQWRIREQATVDLALDRAVTEDRIVHRLGRPGLSHEQRLRLLRAMETRLLQLPRGALGIRMKTDIVEFFDQDGAQIRGVEILELLPGMPAEEHLRVGDVILSIQDEMIDEASEVSSLIKQNWPGEPIDLEVSRDEPADVAGSPRRSRRLRITVTLGSTDQLESQQMGGRGWNEQQKILEQRVRRHYDRFSPTARPLLPPDTGLLLPQVSDLSSGYDSTLILQQLVDDIAKMEAGFPGALSRSEFERKWGDYADELAELIEINNLDQESRRNMERLRGRVLELADIDD